MTVYQTVQPIGRRSRRPIGAPASSHSKAMTVAPMALAVTVTNDGPREARRACRITSRANASRRRSLSSSAGVNGTGWTSWSWGVPTLSRAQSQNWPDGTRVLALEYRLQFMDVAIEDGLVRMAQDGTKALDALNFVRKVFADHTGSHAGWFPDQQASRGKVPTLPPGAGQYLGLRSGKPTPKLDFIQNKETTSC